MFLNSSIYLIVISLRFARTSACPAHCSTEGKAAFPKYQAAVYNLCATLEFTYKRKTRTQKKKNPTKICLSGSSVFIKPKWQEEQQFLLDGECWEQLGAELGGDFSSRQWGEQGYGQGIQQQIWDRFEELWGCTKQDIVSAHFPWSSPCWQQFPVAQCRKDVVDFCAGGNCVVWAVLPSGTALAGSVWRQ